MIKRAILVGIAIMMAVPGLLAARTDAQKLEALRPAKAEIPAGFVIGMVPGFAKKVLKGNPWQMDDQAIKRMAPRIYPGANPSAIKAAHLTIMAREKNPYRDDIVCYVFIFQSRDEAVKEVKKLETHVGHNSDRAILLTEGNSAVFLHVDNIDNMPRLQAIAESIKKRLKNS